MAKKSVVERQKKREILVKKYQEKRNFIKKNIKNAQSFTEKFDLYIELQKLPRDSSTSRLVR